MINFVFDLYGTLVDIRTDEYSQNFKNKFLKYATEKYGCNNTFFDEFDQILNTYTHFAEPNIVKAIHSAVLSSGGTITEEEAFKAALKFRKLSTHRLCLYRGAKALLKSLKRRGAKLYLLSNAQAAFTVYELKKLNIYSYFDGIQLSSDFGERKPSPNFFKHLISEYNLNVCQTVFIGNDINCDIVPAKSAGMCAVYIKSSISPASDSLAEGRQIADYAFENFADVKKLLLNI